MNRRHRRIYEQSVLTPAARRPGSRPVYTSDIATLKRRARQTELGINLALAWLAADTWRKLPRLLRLAIVFAFAFAALWAYHHWLYVALAATLLVAGRLLERSWREHGWENADPAAAWKGIVEPRDDDIPF